MCAQSLPVVRGWLVIMNIETVRLVYHKLELWFSNVSMHQNYLEGLLKHYIHFLMLTVSQVIDAQSTGLGAKAGGSTALNDFIHLLDYMTTFLSLVIFAVILRLESSR